MLIEFNSVVDAVALAVAVQREMKQRNLGRPAERAVRFRIGINIGDVIVEEGDIYGEGVNVAARLEALAEPGGICLSRNVRDEIRNKLDLTLKDMGEIEVKNILRPVRAFQVVFDDKTDAIAEAGHAAPAAACTPSRPRQLVAAAMLLGAINVGGWAWFSAARSDELPGLATEPSLTGLSYTSLSGKTALSEDIIAELSRCRRSEYVSSIDRAGPLSSN
jgi:adenylate cyclase